MPGGSQGQRSGLDEYEGGGDAPESQARLLGEGLLLYEARPQRPGEVAVTCNAQPPTSTINKN